ncbi:metal-dependent hydrolase [Natrialbaceae archaeon AArc-T1-2]|uniref:metal-dependent hydrolase n=1 Tax=Natrialbaceae archaeon AArc-T1-2 TaxID=3053904 RepID=UPI00255B18A1|nr:metal-dependent hydrolase [Natrialbaceae archaeon AArc-T1-2]WIV67507.1 metal-dependent hydrolase [Natrialbaceae archaeon AArc-T1-2]
MWPWEHAIVGYLAYSVFSHLYYRSSPTALETVVVVIASVLPDVIDKPLAWEFGVFESGYALGHSIFVAVPLAIVVGAIAHSRGRQRVGVAFGIGYLLHPPADVLDGYARGGEVHLDVMLWPVAPVESAGKHTGFVAEFWRLFGQYHHQLLAGELSTYLWLQFGLAGGAFLLWLADGAPVLRELGLGIGRCVAAIGGDNEPGAPSRNRNE